MDDVRFFAEPIFQDGIIAQAANDVVNNQGVPYFSAAGSSGNKNDGTASVWEGDYADSGDDFHDFGGGNIFNGVLDGRPFPPVLQWADPLGGSANDYDVCLFDVGLNLVGCSTDIQDGDDDPIEVIPFGTLPGDELLIINFGGLADTRFLHLDTFGAPLQFSTNGSVGGHAGARAVIAVGAVDVAKADVNFTPGVFDESDFPGNDDVEFFSSDGPRRVFFDADGTPFTPGDFTSTGGIVREKPDVAAADGVSTATPGFNPFFGTSASAVHAAGIAVLMLERKPALTPGQIKGAMFSTALDIEAIGRDEDSGFGLIDAFDAVDRIPDGLDGIELINGALEFEDVTDYDPFDSRAPAGVFTIDGTFTNTSETSFFDVFFEVETLTGDNTVLDSFGDGGEGSRIPGPSQFDPDDTFDTTFEIGLMEASPFRFFVDAFGTPNSNGFPGPPFQFFIGRIVVEKQTQPDRAVGVFSFTGSAVPLVAGPIADDGQIVNLLLAPGAFTATEADPSVSPGGFNLTDISCDDAASGTPSTGNTVTRTVTFNLDPDETVTCTFTNAHPGVGGVTEFFASGSGSSGLGMAGVAVSVAGAFAVLVAGNWYARRRWLVKR